ncbi:molecular chaperone HscC [Chitiniphilus shinanonensis]|uniref:Molecular chaperone HscC n=1 Tax=Chitiniphilus shinanonensis TaxID=553088 RepID=A0ABQ6BTP2_9NEIS|nr:molecular chaperone HscC [Chitiniphilus shinanonensis]GLS05151.1 molecular chaperone HscC [Chitiniphilus shinanonensis]
MIIGIDLGTTNSLVAIWRDGQAELVPNAHGHVLTPSVVGLDEQGRVLVGLAAREQLLTEPQRTAALFKRYMGSDHVFKLGDQRFRPEELSALVLKSLKDDAERHLGEPVTEAVITVPAYFSDAQRKATRIAGELAGLRVERLLNEPTAAALAYGLHQRDDEKTFLVFDLGGGTFDVSILELFEGVMEVRASAGDNFLGGEDFVSILVETFLKGPGRPLKDAMSLERGSAANHRLEQALRREGERVKRVLGEQAQAEFAIDWQEQRYSWTIGDEHFAALVEPLLARLRHPVERALRDSRLKLSDLHQVVLVGGASRMPLVRKLVARMFGKFPAVHLNPDEIVAQGAAVQAGLKMRDAALEEVVMTDVCPYTLGIEVSRRYSATHVENGVYLPIIERNSVVPISRSETVSTMSDNQRLVTVRIFQGESRSVGDNVYLGELDIKVPPKPAGEISLEVRFTYTLDGILETECTLDSGERHRLVIEKNPGVLDAEETERRLATLAALKTHPRDQLENTLLLNRAERLYQERLGGEREYVGHLIAQFRAALESQDARTILDARREMQRRLDELAGELLL